MAEGFDPDVLIAGGGPAGLAAAIAARQTGLTVILADPARPPIDKACGEGIMPGGVAALKRLGVAPQPGQFSPLAGIRFVDSEGTVDARFPEGAGCGIRRKVLHQLLADRASEAGVDLRWGSRISSPDREGIRLDGRFIRPRFVIAADGQTSRLRAWAGLDLAPVTQRRFGFRYHYDIEPWSDFVEVHWSECCGEMYITPVAARQICVALITGDSRLNFDEALIGFPALAERLRGAKREARMLGGASTTRRLALVHTRKLALIGEAAGSVDAITGEGLTIAFQQALVLADALRAGDLSLYQAAQRRITVLPHVMAILLLSMERHAVLRHRVFRAFSAKPSLFARLVAIHTGADSPFSFGVRGAVSMGWHLLTA